MYGGYGNPPPQQGYQQGYQQPPPSTYGQPGQMQHAPPQSYSQNQPPGGYQQGGYGGGGGYGPPGGYGAPAPPPGVSQDLWNWFQVLFWVIIRVLLGLTYVKGLNIAVNKLLKFKQKPENFFKY